MDNFRETINRLYEKSKVLDTKAKFAVLMASTIAGFTASTIVERAMTKHFTEGETDPDTTTDN